MKKMLSLLLMITLLVGCGGGDSSRLSKEDYIKQINEKAVQLQTKAGEISSTADATKLIDEVNGVVDEIIELKGPKDLDDKEKKIDEVFEEYKKVLSSAPELAKDPSKATEYMNNLTTVANDLTTALADYVK